MNTHHPDPYRPPQIPTEVFCLHCRAEYESYLLRWRPQRAGSENPSGWCCPTPNCPGRGFGYDIFPIDVQAAGADGPLGEGGDDEVTEEFIEELLYDEADPMGLEIQILTDQPENEPPIPPIVIDEEDAWRRAIRRRRRDDPSSP